MVVVREGRLRPAPEGGVRLPSRYAMLPRDLGATRLEAGVLSGQGI